MAQACRMRADMDEFERYKRDARRERIAFATLTWIVLAFAFIGLVSVVSAIVTLWEAFA